MSYNKRPAWDAAFLAMAYTISKRSHDKETQHGCVITTRNNRVLGVGFNGFPSGMRDDELPNTRPEKYPWMRHSERNAIKNCGGKIEDAVAYITGPPCNDCLMDLWDAGVRCIVYCKGSYGMTPAITPQTYNKEIRETFLSHCGDRLQIIEVEPDFQWFEDLAKSLNKRE